MIEFLVLATLALMPVDADEAPGPLHLSLDEDASEVPCLPRTEGLRGPPFEILETTHLDRGTSGGQEGRRAKGAPEDEPFNPPHGSWAGAGRHFSGEAWKEYVWQDYLTRLGKAGASREDSTAPVRPAAAPSAGWKKL